MYKASKSSDLEGREHLYCLSTLSKPSLNQIGFLKNFGRFRKGEGRVVSTDS